MIEKLIGRSDDLETRADVCVIGSGAGGAVAAARRLLPDCLRDSRQDSLPVAAALAASAT